MDDSQSNVRGTEELKRRITEAVDSGSDELQASQLNLVRWPSSELGELRDQLAGFRAVDLSRNQLTGLVLDEMAFSGFDFIEDLNLSNNLLEDDFQVAVTRPWSGMRVLNLGHNNLHGASQKIANFLSNLGSLKKLSLGKCNLGSAEFRIIVDAVSSELEELNIGNNRLVDEDVEYLLSLDFVKTLKTLNLQKNKLTSESGVMAARGSLLSRVKVLNISGNELGDEGFAALMDSRTLTGLVKLDVTNCGITDAICMKNASGVVVGSLETLDLTANHISDEAIDWLSDLGFVSLESVLLGATLVTGESIAQLLQPVEFPRLQSIVAFGCDIEHLDESSDYTRIDNLMLAQNQITKLPDALIDSRKTLELDVSVNPLNTPPRSIANAGRDAVVDFLHRAQGGLVGDKIARLFVLGKWEVGKTTLVKKLIDPNYRPEPIPRTRGIERSHWSVRDAEYLIELWDFGGQTLQYNCHQWFINPESSYVLVIDADTQHEELNGQLNLVDHLSNSAEGLRVPVMPVLNHNREAYGQRKPKWEIDDSIYIHLDISNSIDVDLASDADHPDVMNLRYQIVNFALKSIPGRIVEDYSLLRETLSEIPEAMVSELQFGHFVRQRLKDRPGLDDLDLSVENSIKYLEYLGAIRHFSGPGIVVTNMAWLLEAIYVVFEPNENSPNRVVDQSGYFSRKALLESHVWRKLTETGQDRKVLFKILMAGQLDLVFQPHPSEQPDLFFVPAYLEDIEQLPNELFENRRLRVVKYQFRYLPPGLFARLIVQYNKQIKRDSCDLFHWRNFVTLVIDLKECHFVAFDDSIYLFYEPEPSEQVKLPEAFRKTLDLLIRDYPSDLQKMMIQCHACTGRTRAVSGPSLGEYERLLRDQENAVCPACMKQYAVRDLVVGMTNEVFVETEDGAVGQFVSQLLNNEYELVRTLFRIVCSTRDGLTAGAIGQIPLALPDKRYLGEFKVSPMHKRTCASAWRPTHKSNRETIAKMYALILYLESKDGYCQERIVRRSADELSNEIAEWSDAVEAKMPDLEFKDYAKHKIETYLDRADAIIPIYRPPKEKHSGRGVKGNWVGTIDELQTTDKLSALETELVQSRTLRRT